MRRRFVARLIVAIAVTALVAVIGTLWLTATTSRSYDLKRSDAQLSVDLRIEADVISWAAQRRTWNGASDYLDGLEKQYGRRVVLLNEDGTALADPASGARPLGSGREVTIDPADAETGDGPGHITPTAAGVLRLAAADQADLWQRASRAASCAHLPAADIALWSTGRPVLQRNIPERCGLADLNRPLGSERAALRTLTTLTNRCLDRAGAPPIRAVVLDTSTSRAATALRVTGPTSSDTSPCLRRAWRSASEPVTPEAVTLYTGDGVVDSPLDLSPGSLARILLATAVMIALVIGVALFIGEPVMRRVRSVRQAALRLASDGAAARIDDRGGDEVAALAAAFNQMADELARVQQERRRLTSDIAHELRTPLTNIRGWLEADLDGIRPPGGDLTRILIAEATQLGHIVDDLQLLALADAGRLQLELQPVDLTGVVRESIDAHRYSAASIKTHLAADMTDGLMTIGDASRLRQVIDNLLSNALTHTPGGRVVVRVHRSSGQTIVEVADDGSGIAAEDLPRVFDRFWRADQSRSRRTGGSGLGLAITQQIVRAHGGSIQVRSTVGEGTVFTVRLPAAVSDPAGESAIRALTGSSSK